MVIPWTLPWGVLALGGDLAGAFLIAVLAPMASLVLAIAASGRYRPSVERSMDRQILAAFWVWLGVNLTIGSAWIWAFVVVAKA